MSEFLRACRREPVKHTPIWIMRQAGRYQPEYRKLRERFSFIEMVSQPEVAAQVTLSPIRQFGMDGIMAVAELCRGKGVLVAPHNWGSLIGYYMQLHIGRAVGNFYRAEHDPVSTDVIAADGYAIEDGRAAVSEAAGFGLQIDEDKFASKAKIRFDLKA